MPMIQTGIVGRGSPVHGAGVTGPNGGRRRTVGYSLQPDLNPEPHGRLPRPPRTRPVPHGPARGGTGRRTAFDAAPAGLPPSSCAGSSPCTCHKPAGHDSPLKHNHIF